MALLTIAEFRTRTGITNSVIPDDRAQSLIDDVSTTIENYVGRPLEQATRTEYYCGSGTRFLVLRCRPIISVTSVHHDPRGYFGDVANSFDSDTLLVSGVDYAIYKYGTTNEPGMLIRIPGVWPEYPRRRESYRLTQDLVPNLGDVKVVYTAGYSTIPGPIKNAACQIITRGLQFLSKGGPIGSETLGDYSYELVRHYMEQNPDLGSVRQLLGRYREVPW